MTAQGNVAAARSEITTAETTVRHTARVEDRYALALYELAAERGVVAVVEADMQSLSATVSSNAELKKALRHPLINRATQGRVLKSIAVKLALNELTQKFLALVAGKNRQAELMAIIGAFQVECAHRRGEVTALVRSATVLSAAQQEELVRILSAKHNAKVKLNVQVDESLLGGMTVTIGAQLYDRTLKSQLNCLSTQLQEAA